MRLVLQLRREHCGAVGFGDCMAPGIVALEYGLSPLAHGYGFLAVFAAGLALRRRELRHGSEEPLREVIAPAHSGEEMATDLEKAPPEWQRRS